MRLRFDQLGKQIGRHALGPSGPTVAHDEIVPDAHHADLSHEPDPARGAERDRLGLVGRIAYVLCLIEIWGATSDAAPAPVRAATLGRRGDRADHARPARGTA
ncbi:Hypothetical protein A7982_11626 [Minicystis rosea]|nr:Hypothetical protein A7982_11626 [Minicystis rosea]